MSWRPSGERGHCERGASAIISPHHPHRHRMVVAIPIHQRTHHLARPLVPPPAAPLMLIPSAGGPLASHRVCPRRRRCRPLWRQNLPARMLPLQTSLGDLLGGVETTTLSVIAFFMYSTPQPVLTRPRIIYPRSCYQRFRLPSRHLSFSKKEADFCRCVFTRRSQNYPTPLKLFT